MYDDGDCEKECGSFEDKRSPKIGIDRRIELSKLAAAVGVEVAQKVKPYELRLFLDMVRLVLIER